MPRPLLHLLRIPFHATRMKEEREIFSFDRSAFPRRSKLLSIRATFEVSSGPERELYFAPGLAEQLLKQFSRANQLSPDSFGFSPLAAASPGILLHPAVQTDDLSRGKFMPVSGRILSTHFLFRSAY